MVKILANPVFMRMAGALIVAVLVMIAFVWIIRRMRKSLTSDADIRPTRESNSTDFTIAAYQGVIQKYKEQEREAARLRDEERQRAAATEKVNTAVLSQLSSGVLLFNRMQLVQQVNPAAKTIFGYASPLGLHARDLFKGISAVRSSAEADAPGGPEALLAALQRCAASGQGAQRLEADYVTPQGQRRVLGITLSAVRDPQGEGLGVACLTSDLTEISELERQMRLRENLASLGEMSAGIAHEFKNSLATILGYAQMLHNERDANVVASFSGKIAEETSNLSRVVTDFLNFARPQDSGGEASGEPIRLRGLIEECSRPYDLDLELNVPEQTEIMGDQTAWRQA
ncbi:MAG TPA: histidine kinase dimerization/phospho-acceptor domain-containing protein, partial [Terriglobales bacterium]|nr:histidine kinase dimerization/phospho-acceptor domain-containing protein [Terriglobales bacterium]